MVVRDWTSLRMPFRPMTATDIVTPLAATIVELPVQPGATVRGDVVAVVEAMKMEHEVRAHRDGVVTEWFVAVGETVDAGAPLMRIDPPVSAEPAGAVGRAPAAGVGAREIAMDAALDRVQRRHALTLDAARPAAIGKRHALGLRTARENLADLCDPGSFVEYGALAVAAQSQRRDADDLIRNTPADGIVTGIGTVNAALHDDGHGCGTRCVVMAYDATVLAGTQGHRSHQKTDRMLGIAHDERLPVVLFAEGVGGRPGDIDMPIVAGLHVPTFARYARLAGRVPVVAIVAGRCFAGNAALAGCSDVIIATRGANIGMGGPAMIEGGGLGVFRPEDVGPAAVLDANGVIDVLCDDEAAAVSTAKRYLGYLQGNARDWTFADQAPLRDALPANRVRAYDVRPIVATLADTGSLLELRPRFGAAILTFLARIEGRPFGLLVSQSSEGGGAIDGDAADKAADFLSRCNTHGLAIVSLIDTPGFMVGPDIEARGQVRHAGRLFIANARLRVPLVAVVLRKAYGLGAMAMTGGGFHAAAAIAAWPTGEFGAMGLEGAVKLGYRKELDAVPDGPARDALFERLVAAQYARGSALNLAATLEIDAVIDPAATRDWIVRRLAGRIAAGADAGRK